MNKNVIWITGIIAALVLGSVIAFAGSQHGATWLGLPLFALCCAAAFLIQWMMFVPAWVYQTEHYFDLTGSLTYISLALIALLFGQGDPRSLLIGALVIIWAGRLGTFLFLRIRAAGEDRRFRSIKTDFLQFLMTWTLQGAWVSITMGAGLAAMTTANEVPLGLFAFLGLLLWVAGFAIEVVADSQKSRFKADPANQDSFIDVGLWRWSRHPNYFGEIVLWIGITMIAFPVLQGWQYATLISPIFVIVLLTKISGVRMLEHRSDKKWGNDPAYQAYKSDTPVLVPRPPRA
jgi:steroid 5-alpha reductase family enzyme